MIVALRGLVAVVVLAAALVLAAAAPGDAVADIGGPGPVEIAITLGVLLLVAMVLVGIVVLAIVSLVLLARGDRTRDAGRDDRPEGWET